MRVLAVSSSPPWPLDMPMRQRTWHFLRALSAVHEVTLLTWGPEPDQPSGLSDVVLLPTRPLARGAAARMRRKARFWGGGLPPWVQAMLEERRFEEVQRRPEVRGSFDVVVLMDEFAACVPLPAIDAPVALHRHNVFSRAIADHVAHSGSYRARWFVEQRRWAAFDRQVMANADVVFTPTGESAAALETLAPGTRIAVLPSGVEVPAPVTRGRGIAFVGWMSYPPNVEAVRWFARAVWPELSARFPEVTFSIVGREPAPAVTALASPRVAVTGAVPDVAAACAGTRVGVVPLHHGMGMKTKTLELMAMGLPVVSTPVGAEGIGASAQDGLVVAADAASFTAAVATLLADGEAAGALGAAARRYVRDHHAWEIVAADHLRHIEALAKRGATTRSGRS